MRLVSRRSLTWIAALGVAGTPALASSKGTGAEDRLPDLRQEAPADISITRSRGRWLLGFRSAVQNVGDGPLVITGSRPNRTTRDMTADQIITRSDGTSRRVDGVGLVRYVSSPDHSHWHFLPFERYELRRPGSTKRLVRDRKSGFCLGDRYRVEPRPTGAVAAPTFVSNCGLRSPRRLTIREGISVGWGDDYAAYLDSQHIDITGIPPGRYVLVHTVNASGRLIESRRTNNTATALIALSRTNDRMRVRVIARSAPK